jgi:predicted DNA-binding transcriptional regulator YafY
MSKETQVTDRIFQLNDYFNQRFGANSAVTIKELKEKFSVRRSQLFKDFEQLKALGAPLHHDRILGGHRYSYVFPLADRILFTPDELAHLRIGVEMLSKIHHLEGFKELPSAFKKIKKAITKWSVEEAPQKAIFFDPLPQYNGGKHLAFFLQAIEYSWQVTFQYQGFQAPDPKTVVFDPYFLRHYDRRWYVGGFSHDPTEGFVRTFPLERIVGQPEQTGYAHDRPPGYAPENYWKNIYGITVPPDKQPEDVILQFSHPQSRYFETTPFFTPFQVMARTDGHLTVRLHLIPNYDLVQKLASLGSGVKVLQPDWFAKDVKKYIREALDQYG